MPLQSEPAGRGASALRVHLALFLVQLAFALLAVEGKWLMGPALGVDPSALAMVRLLGGFGFILAAALARGMRPVRSVRHLGALAGLSVLGVVLNQALYLHGLHRTTPLSATLLVAMIPVFATAASVALGREKLRAPMVVGIALALFGIGVLTGFALPSRGDLYVLLNSGSYALYLALVPGLIDRYGAATVMAYVFGFGALLFLPLGAVQLVTGAMHWSPTAWVLVAFVVLGPTAFAYLANAWALGRARPSLVAVYIYLQPLLVTLLAWLQLGQAPTLRVLAAGLLILLGVSLVTRTRSAQGA